MKPCDMNDVVGRPRQCISKRSDAVHRQIIPILLPV